MSHSNTERLIDYWRARKPGRLSPARTAIEPRDFAELLPQMLILGRESRGRFVFRLIGGHLAGLVQRDLRGVDILTLWSARDRPGLATALEAARRMAEPIVLSAEAVTHDRPMVPVEILLAPLRAEAAPRDRMLGLWQPLQPVSALRGAPIRELRLLHMSAADDGAGLPSVRLATLHGRRIA